MNLWIEYKYANQLQFKLERFKVKKQNPYVANFRCPFCGDSERVKSKTRGYLIENKAKLWFKCHNCQLSMIFGKFIQKIAPSMAEEYRLEAFRDRGGPQTSTQRITQTQYLTTSVPTAHCAPRLTGIVKVSSLPADHAVRKYVDSRKIPTDQQFRLYYVDEFKAWINTLIPDKFENLKNDGPRLVMPMKNIKGKVVGFNARDMNPVSSLRYISIMLDEEHPKIFGLECCDLNKDSFILEGPIDSLFVDNSLAMAGASIGDLSKVMNPEKAIFVFDNEPRNESIISQMRKVIKAGYRTVIFPESVVEKDINDMIQHGGKCKEEVSILLHKNTYKGAAALLRLNEWRKTA